MMLFRHIFPVCLSLALSLTCLFTTVTAEAQPASRPNILWITCEDISPNLGCYGDDYARTPVLDGLAAQGVRYVNAYGVTGVCSPNRSCLITGVYPSSLGSHGMRSTTRLPDSIKCFTEYLQAAGYYCTNNVKTDYNFATPKTAWNESSNKAHWRKRKEGQQAAGSRQQTMGGSCGRAHSGHRRLQISNVRFQM